MSNQQYSSLLKIISDLGQQMAEGFASINTRLDRHESLHIEHNRNFASIYEILQDITDHLPVEPVTIKR